MPYIIMDLMEYIGVVRRRIKQIISFAILLAVLTGIFTAVFGNIRYRAELFVTTTSKDTSDTQDYRYSNYYNEFSANNFNNTIIGWMASSGVASAAYAKAEIDSKDHGAFWQKFSAPFSAKKRERNNVAISINAYSEDAVRKLADGLFLVLQEWVNRYNQSSGSKYEIINQDVSVSTMRPRASVNMVMALIVGFILGVMLAYLYEYATNKVSTANAAADLLGKENLAVINSWEGSDWQYIRVASKKFGTDLAVLVDFDDKNKAIQKCLSSHKLLLFPMDADELHKSYDKPILVFYRLSRTRKEQLQRIKSLIKNDRIQSIAIDI